MARYKIVEETKNRFYVYKKGWLFWKCMNPVDYHDLYWSKLAFKTFDEAYQFYVDKGLFKQRVWTYG